MATKAHNGPHKYIRVLVGLKKRPEMKCSIRGCPHHIKPELAVGRESICNICEDKFYLTKGDLLLAKPHCIACTKKKVSSEQSEIAVESIAERLERMGLG